MATSNTFTCEKKRKTFFDGYLLKKFQTKFQHKCRFHLQSLLLEDHSPKNQ